MRRGGRRRVAPVLGLLLLAVLTGLVWYLAWQRLATPVPSTRTRSAVVVTPTAEVPQRPTAVFLGDSYVQGRGASAPSSRWSSLVAGERGWDEVNLGLGGTGYVATSGPEGCGLDFCPSVEAQVAAAVARAPDVVVVAGGQNDFTSYQDDPEAVDAAIAATFEQLRRQLPAARLVAVGPSTTRAVGAVAEAVDVDVRTAAAAVGAQYVSLLEPNVIAPGTVLPDGAHVDDAGHRAIADRVLAAVP